ncbi:hypothetical protein I5I61_09715, partial [Pseudomonas nitroreducens]|nr:hypothetical protein [Pseudomonas nitroreducens]
MDIEHKRDDDFKPSCQKCGGIEFVAVQNRYVARTEQGIGMIVCADEKCQAVAGV